MLLRNIDHLYKAPGVLAVRVCGPGGEGRRGQHEEALRLALLQRDELNVDETSTIAGALTILVQREVAGTVAIAMVTGHAGRKSIRRTIRRLATGRRGEVAGPTPEPTSDAPADAAEAFR